MKDLDKSNRHLWPIATTVAMISSEPELLDDLEKLINIARRQGFLQGIATTLSITAATILILKLFL